jgi:hypothetical protein
MQAMQERDAGDDAGMRASGAVLAVVYLYRSPLD